MINIKQALLAVLLLGITQTALAHQPVIEKPGVQNIQSMPLDLKKAMEIKDPTKTSQAVYGRLSEPNQIDLYSFTANKDEKIPIEVLVAVRRSNTNFRPTFVFVQPILQSLQVNSGWTPLATLKPLVGFSFVAAQDSLLPFALPNGWKARRVDAPRGERKIFFEPYSMEKYYHSAEKKFTVEKGGKYYIAIYEPNHYMGDYVLGLGTAEDFSGISFLGLIKDIFVIKLGLIGGVSVPWLDIIGLFLFILGFILGLGALVTDNKELMWFGIVTATTGGAIFYRISSLSGTALFHLLLLAIIVINGILVSKKVKSRAPVRISLLCWGLALFLLVWNIIMLH